MVSQFFLLGIHTIPRPTRVDLEPVEETLHRNPVFCRKILAVYGCLCAACGLRINLSEVNDVTSSMRRIRLSPLRVSSCNADKRLGPSNGYRSAGER